VVESRVRAEASHNPTFPIPSQESNFGNSANSYFYNNFIGVWDTVETRLVDPYVPNRWYQEKVVVKDMTHIDYYIDGNLLLANRPPAGSTTSLSYIYIGVDQGASAAGYYDNIFVRRYAATVPTFVLDEAVPPTVNAGADHTQSAVFTQTATASDAGSGINPSSYQWAKVSGPGTVTFGSANALSTTISVDQDGTYVIAFTAQDLAGNSAASTFTLVWDTTLPVVTGVSEGGTYDTDKTITFNEGTAALDSAAFASGGTVSTEGSHTLVVTSAGGTVTIHFTIDKTDPDSFTPDSPSGTITDRTPAFSWHVWPHATKYQLYLDGALEADNLSAPSYTTPVELACGNHTWQARAFRAEENPINTGLVSFTINCGGGFMPPAKPSIAETKVTDAGGRLDIFNLPANIVQFAASATIDFKQASWQALDRLQTTLARFADTAKFYLKFRSREGGVSDVLTYENKDLGSVKISEGDIVKTADNPDVYIIKYKNGKQYKRLILSPSVFRSYGHLKWENIKTIPRAQMDSFATSSLVQVGGDKKVYELFPEGDTGRRKVFAVYKDGILKQVQDDTSGWDADSVYEINAVDRDSYILEK
jgi:hypothetical protein